MSTSDRDHEFALLTDVETDGPPIGNFARRAVLVRLADVAPEPVTWLWHPYVPLGKVTLLEGDPAAGKTWLALAIAAAVSRGRALPDGAGTLPGAAMDSRSVVYLTAEDGLADTLRPRLDAIGADVSRVHALTAGRDGSAEIGVTLADIDILDDALTSTGAVLLVVDPLQGFLGARVDMHRANEVRPVLTGLARLAERHACAVLAIRHLSKASADRTLYRGLGSIDFAAAARSVLLAGRDPQEPTRRAVVQTKNSLAPEGPALAYAIDGGRFEWAGLSPLTAASMLAADSTDSDRSAIDDARDFLAETLTAGPVAAKDVQRQARDVGIAERTLARAKNLLMVRAVRTGGLGTRGKWQWELSPAAADDGTPNDPKPAISALRVPTLPHGEGGSLNRLGSLAELEEGDL